MSALDIIKASDPTDDILDIVAFETQIDRAKLQPDTSLEQLNIQSADYVLILLAIEEKFGVYMSVDSELADAKTIGDLLRIVSAKINTTPGQAHP